MIRAFVESVLRFVLSSVLVYVIESKNLVSLAVLLTQIWSSS
jgi:hypothetical protein